ncbi:MAG: DEAD/DEAH box helicase family protein [Candidatus Izemoplasmatales bacterium]
MKETMFKPANVQYTKVQSLHNNLCERCLSDSSRHRTDFYGRSYCLDCEPYGLSTNLTSLYRYHRMTVRKDHILSIPFSLSSVQKEGSSFFLHCLEQKKSGYLNAVCGAGKTEMMYDTILYALNQNYRVCITIPRRQVVEELSKRIQSVFPRTTVRELHQDAKEDEGADIIISTTQQLIRYYQEFDLLIIDEFDAFPLKGNPFLYRLIQKSLKPDGVLLIMSATVTSDTFRVVKQFEMQTYDIYERFHGEDMDIPKIHLERNLYGKILHNELPIIVKKTLDQWLQEEKYVFVFVPTIKRGELLLSVFQEYGYQAKLFTSKTIFKSYELKDFEKRKTEVIISTSILERGVTYPNLYVMIFWADHSIFSKEMMIQIAGRVGRKADFPHGEIIMFSEKITKAMEEAINHIKKMNREKNKRDLCIL